MNFREAAGVVRRYEQAMMLSGTISGIDRIFRICRRYVKRKKPPLRSFEGTQS